jgi:uncharacterized membrane protein
LAAAQKSYTLPRARIEIAIERNGAVKVTENITYSFSGDFSGGYREIPLRVGESISNVSVSEGGRAYAPGAPTEIGSSGAPNSFGWTPIPDGVRIVWHYSAAWEQRTFTVNYTLHNFVTAYRDVADFNMKVWGDQWTVPVDLLEAELRLPGRSRDVRVWGHVARPPLEGGVAPSETGASLRAEDVSGGNWVELRAVFPRTLLGPARNARKVEESGLQGILDEEREYGEQYEAELDRIERDRERVSWLLDNLGRVGLGMLVAAVFPAGLVGFGIWTRFGKEPRPTAVVPEHLMEPPGDERPALIAALLEPSAERVTGDAFAATLFDLIRRGFIDAIPTTTIKKTWAGLRSEDISDLVLTVKEKDTNELLGFEKNVLSAVKRAAKNHERFHLSQFRDEIKREPVHYHGVFDSFKKGVNSVVKKRRWWLELGRKPVIFA